MARAIDASHFGEIMEQWKKDCLECDDQHGADVIIDVILQLDDMPTFTQPNEPLTVTEVCPHCESEITMEWDVKTRGHKAFCPVCGNRLMLCDECQHGEPGHICDYDSNKDTCRFNRRPPEGEEET